VIESTNAVGNNMNLGCPNLENITNEFNTTIVNQSGYLKYLYAPKLKTVKGILGYLNFQEVIQLNELERIDGTLIYCQTAA